jgi:tetratricopeptide (TPR) repeat protein
MYASFARILAREGDEESARKNYEKTLELRTSLVAQFPEDPGYRSHLGSSYTGFAGMLRDLGDSKSARTAYEHALAVRTKLVAEFPDNEQYRRQLAEAANFLAWLLATSVDDTVRDGKRAVELATMACEIDRQKDPRFVDTLAAAYAESGEFDTAVQWSKKALAMITTPDLERWRKPFQAALSNYEAKQPTREDRSKNVFQNKTLPSKKPG